MGFLRQGEFQYFGKINSLFMPPCNVRAIPAFLTDVVLESYAAHLAAQRALPEDVSTGATTGAASPEEVLAPLLLIHGKVFTSAIGIALHGAESIIRYVACDNFSAKKTGASNRAEEEEEREQEPVDADGGPAPGRCVYFVGEHRLFSPHYCPCGAYGYQGIRRQETWFCKHLLALRIALVLEKRGLAKDAIRERRVSASQLQEMMQQTE